MKKIFNRQHNVRFVSKNLMTTKIIQVSGHCHILGHYRGAAHKLCNLKLALKPGITPFPVVIHNLKGYDTHPIMQHTDTISDRILCIPSNSEKYISFSVGQLKCLESFQFMASSLEKLTLESQEKS